MPLYEYQSCAKCGYECDCIFPIGRARKSVRCQNCNGRAVRVYSAPAIQFKGSGFYNTDYKRKKEHGAKEDKPPQEVKKDADKTVTPIKPA